jgi:hypothetical protein
MTKRICTRCGNLHDDDTSKCWPCMVVTGKACQATQINSQSEADWQDHVEEHKHELDYQNDGKYSEA